MLRSTALVALASLLACGDPTFLPPPPAPTVPDPDAGVETDAGAPMFPDSGVGTERLTLASLAPDHGPFIGGTVVLVRGSGFRDGVAVTVGGRDVQVPDTEVIDANTVAIVVPPGDVGPADVVVTIGEQEASLPGGYNYDSFYVTPSRAAAGGGAIVQVIGTGLSFDDEDQVLFGGVPCQALEVVSEGTMDCTIPAGPPGVVDVSLVRGDGTELVLEDAFTYIETADPLNGGLGGGDFDGTLNITVLNAGTGAPEADTYVILGEDLETPYQGLTGPTGQITFSGTDIVAPVTIHAAKECFANTSFVSFDARDVTVFLVFNCPPPPGAPPPGGPGRNGSFVSGELIWEGPNEFGPNPWDNIPEPREGWTRRAFVTAAEPCSGTANGCLNPDPTIGGGDPTVCETPVDDGTDDTLAGFDPQCETGERGYPYRIFVAPRAMAIYAIAGLQNIRTLEFIPYVMGVARNVLAGPGEEVTGVNPVMNVPLDHFIDVRLDGLPEPLADEPNRFVTQTELDLGGEGLIVKRFPILAPGAFGPVPIALPFAPVVGGGDLDVVRARRAERPFRFLAQPALFDGLSDGRFRVQSGWVTGTNEGFPETNVVRTGIRSVDSEVVLDGFLGIPDAAVPVEGGTIPEDRILRWTATEGGADPDFHLVLIADATGNELWRMFVPGSLQEAQLPDLSTIPGIADVPDGRLIWALFAISIPGFDFDTVNYGDLAQRRWDAWSINQFIINR
ncbi:MAG: IPT/TIG domain-containing protein [Myxococcota bacterium]